MKRVVFDTDIGIDDAMALLFLQAAADVRLEAICTGAGNASLEAVTRNALYVCERFAIDAPVHAGADAPLGDTLAKSHPDFVHGCNGLGDIALTEPQARAASTDAAGALVDLARRYPGDISVVAVGRLTNIARALERCPELPSLLRELIVMGGVFLRRNHRGNLSPVAEANVAGDPLAADRVFGSGIDCTIVGLDVTQETFMDETFIEALRACAGDAGEFIHAITRYYFEFYSSVYGRRVCPIHDASAVACLLAPELYGTESGPVRVVTEGIAMGQTIFGPEPDRYAIDAWRDRPACRICTTVDAAAVRKLYLDTMGAEGQRAS